MLRDFASAAGDATWSEIGLVVAFVAFLILAVWVLSTRRARWERARHMPLEDGSPVGPHTASTPPAHEEGSGSERAGDDTEGGRHV